MGRSFPDRGAHAGAPSPTVRVVRAIRSSVGVDADGRCTRSSISKDDGYSRCLALLEIAQIWIPGRTAQVIDYGASAIGASGGLCVAAMIDHLVQPSLDS